jgi:hypothetical protein
VVSITTTGPRLWRTGARADRPPPRRPGGGSPQAALRDRGRPALPGPLPGGAVVQAAGAGRFPGLAPAHRRGRLPGQLRRAPPGSVEQALGVNAQMSSLGGLPHTGAGDATRARGKGGARRRPGSSSIGAAAWPPACAWRARVRSRRSSAGSSGAVPTGGRSSAGDLGRRRASGDRSPPRADGASRASCGSPSPAGSATRRAKARPYLRVCRPLGRFVHRNVYAEHRGGLEAPAPDWASIPLP